MMNISENFIVVSLVLVLTAFENEPHTIAVANAFTIE